MDLFARLFMSVRECFIKDHAQELQEETLADLHHCLDQLTDRNVEMEEKMNTCMQRAAVHLNASKASISPYESLREKSKAKQFLQEKRRLQLESDKLSKNIALVQQQIDTIISSQLNMSVVGAMKQFNFNATRLSIPTQTYDIENLEEQLAERASEISNMKQAMDKISGVLGDESQNQVDESDLWQELDAFMGSHGQVETFVAADVHDLQQPETSDNLPSSLPEPKIKPSLAAEAVVADSMQKENLLLAS